MRTVAAQDLFHSLNALVHGENTFPSDQEFARFRLAFDLSLNRAWRSEWWPDLMRTQKRYFRAAWASGTTYAKLDERYDAASQQYYQSLRNSNTGNAPTSSGVENSAYWALCKSNYSGPDWVTATVYAVGAIIFYPTTGYYYQCHTAHTSSGTLIPTATGGNERWGQLTEFDRYVSLTQTGETEIGDVMDCRTANPKTHPNDSRALVWDNSENGIQILENAIYAWVMFRLKRPRLLGDVFSTTATYAVDDQVYFASTTVRGNFYNCITATSAAESPSSASAKWSVVSIPEQFATGLIYAAQAKCLTGDDKAMVPQAIGLAEEELELEADVIYRQQSRTPSRGVVTY